MTAEYTQAFEDDARSDMSTRELSLKHNMGFRRAKRLREEITGTAAQPRRSRRGPKVYSLELSIDVEESRFGELLNSASHQEALEVIRRTIATPEEQASACALILQLRLDALYNPTPQTEEEDLDANTTA